MVSRATRYDIKGKKYIDTPQKYYFSDVGLRNARINFRQIEENHTMENILYNELLSRDFNVDVGLVMVSGKDSDGKLVRKQLEVDFVCNKGSKRYYIQSAFAIPDEAKMQQESTLCAGLMIRSRRSSWSRMLQLPGIPRRASW